MGLEAALRAEGDCSVVVLLEVVWPTVSGRPLWLSAFGAGRLQEGWLQHKHDLRIIPNGRRANPLLHATWPFGILIQR